MASTDRSESCVRPARGGAELGIPLTMPKSEVQSIDPTSARPASTSRTSPRLSTKWSKEWDGADVPSTRWQGLSGACRSAGRGAPAKPWQRPRTARTAHLWLKRRLRATSGLSINLLVGSSSTSKTERIRRFAPSFSTCFCSGREMPLVDRSETTPSAVAQNTTKSFPAKTTLSAARTFSALTTLSTRTTPRILWNPHSSRRTESKGPRGSTRKATSKAWSSAAGCSARVASRPPRLPSSKGAIGRAYTNAARKSTAAGTVMSKKVKL
mmetsp:Transcript_1101/g.2499  ORF Transcript_1101/g.2499 Transcript_1101/m.2499 type:complete len:268 (+) Transcript_1101:3-806(+)